MDAIQTQPLAKRVGARLWHSPTITTWASTVSRASGVLIVMPLVLARLGTAEIAVWYLFLSVISLQLVADAGFAPTFTRMIAYATADVDLESQFPQEHGQGFGVRAIWVTTHRVYNRLSLFALCILALVGTWALRRPVAQMASHSAGWTAWVMVMIGTAVVLRGNAFSAFLQGVNEVALLRRWEAITAVASTITSALVLLFGGGIVGLAIATQTWSIIGVARNYFLSRYIQKTRFKWDDSPQADVDRAVFQEAWPPAWRSAVGIGMSRGVIYLTGLVYAQFAAGPELASYLLAIRLITAVAEFSQGPFYSKLPVLAKYFAGRRHEELVCIAERGMRLSYWAFVIGFAGVGIAGPALLRLIHSHAAFVSQTLWVAIGSAFFLERYGAMHLQLFSTTGRILWHVANGVSGVVNVLVVLALYRPVGVMAFPIGLAASNVLFYCWYSARLSYRAFKMPIIPFELRTVFGPAAVVLSYIAVVAGTT